jgi:uncharacterized Zn finger protein
MLRYKQMNLHNAIYNTKTQYFLMDIIDVECPVCETVTEHEILRGDYNLVVQCSQCDRVQTLEKPKEPALTSVKTIISKENQSFVCRSEMYCTERVAVGDHIVAECDADNAFGVEIMSIECGPKRVTAAQADEIDTLWTRSIDEVVVRFSVHKGQKTIPLYLVCEGNARFYVGEQYEINGVKCKIHHIKLRNGTICKRIGKYEPALTIKRVYAYAGASKADKDKYDRRVGVW